MGDLGASRHALQLSEREGVGTSDQAAHAEPPIGKAAGPETLVGLGLWRIAADRHHLGDLAAVELPGQ